jgi:phage/plasmid primase-like uncharacterized protein
MSAATDSFRTAMANTGMSYSGSLVEDGKLHRFNLEGESGESCWYVLHPDDPIPAGAFGCWRRNINERWYLKTEVKLSYKEYAAVQKKWKEAEARKLRDEQERHTRMALKAFVYFSALPKATADHPYLITKKVGAHGDLRVNADGDLVLPLIDSEAKPWSYQTIDSKGDKLFMPGGRVQGCLYWIKPEAEGPLVICEGYATGATLHEATGYSICCAMNCGNLAAVAKVIREKFPSRILVIAADDDRFTAKGDEPYNPGLEKAKLAAASTKSILAVPTFSDQSSGTDFNDLAGESGLAAVRSCLDSLLGVGMGRRVNLSDLLAFVPSEDPDSLVGNRYLCRGGSCVIVAQTSAGKSSLGMQIAVMWALGMPFFGIKPSRPLKSLIVQAENDDGDTAEMFQGILLGLGLVSEDSKTNADLIRRLQANLIIIRDQTHIGNNFPPFAAHLCEIHKPDIFWTDPFLSFYGDDINDQKSMSQFLRAQLNPISERNGVIWMMLHHTGKPSKDAKKSQKSWSARDFSYMGIGSSELSNWARAIICLSSTSEDEFRLILAKRGWRAGVVDDTGAPSSELNLAYSTDHICWRRIPKPSENGEMISKLESFARSLVRPMKASEIIKNAASRLQRGERTCWSLWDRGEGDLGHLFTQNSDSLWIPKSLSQSAPSLPYSDT